MTVYDIISAKRDGNELNRQQINFIIDGLTQNTIPDYQVSAWLMAVYLNGMTDKEKWFLTEAMLHSGKIVDLSTVKGVKVDKHSTGGVGDKTSIILAPVVAAAGIPVPMISGRGLGHTGGTLDKLQSIPGFKINLSIAEYKKAVADIGMCMIGQTQDIAPADKKLYALRDVTATVQSIPLISASIMSKKLAEGIDSLVLDVKTGSGAFMVSYDKATELAKSLISIGKQAGKQTVAYITDMEQPLGKAVGNWLEIKECIYALQDRGPEDLMEVTHCLSGTMIWLGKKAGTIKEGVEISKEIIKSGKAWDKFLQMVDRQGGSVKTVKNPDKYPDAKYQYDVKSQSTGYINKIDALEIGLCSVGLGAGRLKQDDKIDPAAGIILYKKVCDSIQEGETILTMFSEHTEQFDLLNERLKKAVVIKKNMPETRRLIYKYIE